MTRPTYCQHYLTIPDLHFHSDITRVNILYISMSVWVCQHTLHLYVCVGLREWMRVFYVCVDVCSGISEHRNDALLQFS